MKNILEKQDDNCKQNFKKTSHSQLTLELPSSGCKPVYLNFNGGDISSDAGVLLIKENDRQIGLLENMAKAIPDNRDQRYIDHTYLDLLRQRVAQITCGYEDANDCDDLRTDPSFKIFADRNPESDPALGSQPTMSRFENDLSRKSLYRLAEVFVDTFIASYEKPPEAIVLDFDDTADKTYGAQQMTLFNGYIKNWCYLPLHVYEGLSGKLITTMLKSGKRSTAKQILAVLKRLVARLRKVWPDTWIVFRGDSHFASPKIREWIDAQDKVRFVTGLTAYEPLKKQVAPLVERAKNIHQRTQNKVTLYHSFRYKAQSWHRYYRVIAKVEVSAQGTNIRFIVTDLEQAKAKRLYQEVYCARGAAELNIKEHKLDLKSDRTSCHRFEANQFRLFLHSAAYVLFHALRSNVLQNTRWAKASMGTIRLRFLKIGASVRELKTRIWFDLPSSYPLKQEVMQCFQMFQLLTEP
ncbi:MAG: IS1380 family transposase [Aliifodinibius sp.]|nr:IS1380 family transposase [Fodinibius sp.]NIV14841.1 IS1380 family transposase [Fodinibius sp.]NIY28720.1 IS1380 family transposase [Fodinibius sp.]